MKKKTIIFSLVTIAVFVLLAIERLNSGPVTGSLDNKKNQKNYFYPQEKITYDVKLGALHIGKAELNYLSLTELGQKKADLITFETKVTNFYDKETIYSAPQTLLPFRIERDIHGWMISEKIIETYDQKNFTLSLKKEKGSNVTELVIKSSSPIQNAILLPFFVRSMPELRIGWSFKVNLGTNQFDVKLVSIENIKTPAGTFKAYYFRSSPEKFNIWISADNRRVPVKMKGLGNFGYTMVLRKYSFEGLK